MSRIWETTNLLKQGLSPEAIAQRLRISSGSVFTYLDRAVGEGLIRRSDIYFAFPLDERNSPKIEQRYGSARVAFGDLYDDVRHIEVTIHALIRDILVRRHGDGEAGWWRKGVPEAVRVKCQDRRERDADEPCDPYCYTDLLDLAKIIETQWSLFKDRFPTRYSSNRKALLDDLGRLNRIRNKVMHPVRGVAPAEDDFDFVRALGHDLAPPPSAA